MMRWERDRSGLLLPNRPGLCSLFGVTHLCGFGGGGEVTGDQPFWNASDKSVNVTLSDSDRTWSNSLRGGCRSTASITSLGRYVEVLTVAVSNDFQFGIATSGVPLDNGPGEDANGHVVRGDGQKRNNGNTVSYGTSISNGDTLMLAFSGSAVWWGKNGTWFNSGDPAAGTGAAYTGLSGAKFLACGGRQDVGGAEGGTLKLLADYSYAPPAGFLKGW